MKKWLLMIAAIGSFCFSSCSEQDIETFGTERFVYFQKFWKDAPAPGTEKADTTEVSFWFAKEADTHVYGDLQVVLSGRPLDRDLQFKLRVVDEMTTALPNEYTIDDFYTFRAKPIAANAKQIDDTIHIQINRSERLETMPEGYQLTVEIVPTEDLFVGQFERSRAVLHIKKDPVKPTWWTKEVTAALFGEYTPEKYKLFLQNVEGAEKFDDKLIKEQIDVARKLVLKYKQWLSAQSPKYDEILNSIPL